MDDLPARLSDAVRLFWETRQKQSQRQGTVSGVRDAGARSAVTGGAQMDGFVNCVRDLLQRHGVPKADIYCKRRVEIPGWFRPEKCWDVLVVSNDTLIAAIEVKSQIGPSFGNNYNNRTEVALGSATDVLAAYREGAFKPAARPWLGYLMLLEETAGSVTPVRAREPHFKVFPEFRDASYAQRYEILLTKLLRDRLYDGACLLLSDREHGPAGIYREPNPELAFARFVESPLARTLAAAIAKRPLDGRGS
jgi:hypothetical protein